MPDPETRSETARMLDAPISKEDIIGAYKVMCFRGHDLAGLERVLASAQPFQITAHQAFLRLLELPEFADAMNIQLLKEYGQPVPVRTSYGPIIFAHAWDFFVSDYVRRTGVWEPAGQAVMADLVKPGWAVANVGGNIGTHAALLATLTGKSGEVHVYEPVSYNISALRRMVGANRFDHVHVYPMAASALNGMIDIATHPSNSGGNSVALSDASEALETVRAVRLDDHLLPKLTRLDFLLIDVEGFEGSVLAGAEAVLKKFRPNVMMEFAPENLRARGTDPAAMVDGLIALGLAVRCVGHEQILASGKEAVSFVESRTSYMDIIATR